MSDVLELIDDKTYDILSSVFHDLQSRVLLIYQDIYEKYGLVMRTTCGLRSIEEQDKLYAKGRTAPGNIVTNAKGQDSWHSYGLAVDSCFVGSDPYLEKHPKGNEIWQYFGKKCEDYQMIWGNTFLRLKDKPHCEKHYDMDLKACKILYDAVGIQGLWNQINSKLQEINNKETLH